MKNDPITYSRVKGKTRYWEPSKRLKALGYKPKNWPEGPAGRHEARQETARALRSLDSGEARPEFEVGSLAHYWHAVFYPRQVKRFEKGKIAKRTLADYRVAWIHINTEMGAKVLDQITFDQCEDFFDWLTDNHSPKVRHRCMTKLKEIMAHAVTDRLIPSNPAALVKNPAPKGRSATFTQEEIMRLIDCCLSDEMIAQEGAPMEAMSLIIRIMYETARAPIDARLLTLSAIASDREGYYIDRSREKTGVEGYQPIPVALYEDIMAYVGKLGVQPLPETPIFRQHKPKRYKQNLTHWRDDSDFAKDFAIVRRMALGPEETRRAMDIRRTANLEADLGDASPEDRAKLLANSLDKNKTLDRTYTPLTLAGARKANAAREKGRAILKSARGQNKNASDGKRG